MAAKSAALACAYHWDKRGAGAGVDVIAVLKRVQHLVYVAWFGLLTFVQLVHHGHNQVRHGACEPRVARRPVQMQGHQKWYGAGSSDGAATDRCAVHSGAPCCNTCGASSRWVKAVLLVACSS